ncbi:hypothetical protein AUK22_01665 [bacterium CG2_30_54_10]|nr:MAG: hypothetical protein AUK22_01665 [bacterium CG2_30_54_10]
MKKRTFPTAIALIVFVLLGIYASKYEVEEKLDPGKDKPVELAKVDVKSVKIATWKQTGQAGQVGQTVQSGQAGRAEVRVEIRPGASVASAAQWFVTQPKEVRGDEDEIVGALKCFEDLSSEAIISLNATDTACYGLGTQSPELTIESGSGTVSFSLGDSSPVGGSNYFRKAGDPAVYLVPGSVAAAFKKGFNDLRSKKIFHEDFAEVGSITLTIGSETIHLEHQKNLEWKIVSPRELDADIQEVSGLLAGIHELKISRFVNDQPAEKDDFGFLKPRFRAVLGGSGNSAFELLAGRLEGGEVFVKRGDRPNVFAVNETALALLEKGLNKVRTKELPRVRENEVSRIVLGNGTATFQIDHASSTWMCRGEKIDDGKVLGLVKAYLNNNVRTFLPLELRDGERLGLKDLDTAASFELITASGSRKVFLGKGNGTEVSIIVNGENEIFQVPIQTFEAFKSLLDAATPKPVAAPRSPAIASSSIGTTSSRIGTPSSSIGAVSPSGGIASLSVSPATTTHIPTVSSGS